MIETLLLSVSVFFIAAPLYFYLAKKKAEKKYFDEVNRLRAKVEQLEQKEIKLLVQISRLRDDIADIETEKNEVIRKVFGEEQTVGGINTLKSEKEAVVPHTSSSASKDDLNDLSKLMERASELRLTALRDNMKKLITEIEGELSKSNVEKDFKIVGADFIAVLSQKFPDLSVNEVRICTYIRLGYATKEIAGFLNVEPESVSKARNRLRKKLGINSKTHIEDFLDEMMKNP